MNFFFLISKGAEARAQNCLQLHNRQARLDCCDLLVKMKDTKVCVREKNWTSEGKEGAVGSGCGFDVKLDG